MPRLRAFYLAGMLLFVIAASARGQSPILRSIHFEGAPDYSDAELMSAAGLKEGQSYSSDELQQRAKELIDTGIFEKVDYKFEGSKLNYSLSLVEESYPVIFGNVPLEKGPALDARIHQRVPLYHGKVPAEGTLLEGVRRALEAILAGEGVHAHVIATPVGDGTTHNVIAIRFSIDAPAVRIGSVRFDGVSDWIRPQLQGIVVRAGLTYDSAKSVDEIERQVADFYIDHGFAAVQVRASRSDRPSFADGAIRVPFTVTVKEGRPYRLGTVQISPEIPIDGAEIGRLMAARATTIPESTFIGTLVSQLQSLLKAKGYLDCRVIPQPELQDAAGVVNYVVSADLGTLYRLEYVKSAGGSQ
ncbi:MAG: POTRA domain-containing protein [Terracidiphilus sp.]